MNSFGLHRVWAIILRNLYLYKRSIDRLTDSFFWPVVDLVVLGLMSSYFTSAAGGGSSVMTAVIAGIILWMFVYRSQFEFGSGLLEDVQNRNLINIFVSPIRFSEWTFALFLHSLIKTCITVTFGFVLAFILYRINLLPYIPALLPYILVLIIFGMSFGFIITGIILRFGTRVQAFAWALIWTQAPFVAIYYPLSILPNWAQAIGHMLPPSYAFEGMRIILQTGLPSTEGLLTAYLLNGLYLILGGYFLYRSFKKVLNKGLVKVF